MLLNRLIGLQRVSSAGLRRHAIENRMYSLRLTCRLDELELLSAELWACGTMGIQELDNGISTELIAQFATSESRDSLLDKFSGYQPRWARNAEADWVRFAQDSWPGREIGSRLFVATPWCQVPTPCGRERVVQNPGLASGTGEHPCTQLALEALEISVFPGCTVADIGTGSGILVVAALQLGAVIAIGIDPDEVALTTAKENFQLNNLPANLVAGSAECLASERAHVVVANINASVLLSMADELLRVVRPHGSLILTGFPEAELDTIERVFGVSVASHRDGWSCIISQSS